jgi:hypothetical protein
LPRYWAKVRNWAKVTEPPLSTQAWQLAVAADVVVTVQSETPDIPNWVPVKTSVVPESKTFCASAVVWRVGWYWL